MSDVDIYFIFLFLFCLLFCCVFVTVFLCEYFLVDSVLCRIRLLIRDVLI